MINHIKLKNIFAYICVTTFPVFLLLIASKANSNFLLYDDNFTQFLTLIDFGFKNLFQGHLPLVDFHQMLGMPIIEQGIYGYTNLIMAISYLIAQIKFLDTNTITVYIYISFVLGSIFAYLLATVFCSNKFYAVLVTLAYNVVIPYLSSSGWYYVWNNFFVVPLLLYACFLTITYSSKILLGLAVSVCVALGNIQYAAYDLIAVLILTLWLIAFHDERLKLLKLLAYNFLTCIFCLLPVLILYVRILTSTISVVGDPAAYATALLKIFYSVLFPPFLLDKSTYYLSLYKADFIFYANFFIGALAILAMWGFCIAVYYLVKRIDKRFSVWVIASFSTALFFFFSMSGHDSLIYNLFFLHTSILKEFRFPFKFIFVIPPLLIPGAAYSLEYLRNSVASKPGKILFLAVIIGLVSCSVYYIFTKNWESDKRFTYSSTKAALEKNKIIDANNFRFIGVKTEKIIRAFNSIENFLAANAATDLNEYAVGGYQMRPLNIANEIILPIYNGAWFYGTLIPIEAFQNAKFTSTFCKASRNSKALISTSSKGAAALLRVDGKDVMPMFDNISQLRAYMMTSPYIFRQNDRDIITKKLKLADDGSITGYSSSSEQYWILKNGCVSFSGDPISLDIPRIISTLSVKYIIYERDDKVTPSFLQNQIEKNIPWVANTNLLILKNVKSIVSDSASKIVSFTTTSDSIKWHKSMTEHTTYSVNFLFDKRFDGYFYPESGGRFPLSVKSNNHFIQVDVPYEGAGQIILKMHDVTAMLAIIISYFVTIFSLILCFFGTRKIKN